MMNKMNNLKKFVLFTVIFCLTACVLLMSSCEENVEYAVTVKDSSGNTIENASVMFNIDGAENIVSTDVFGKAVYSASSGSNISVILNSLPSEYKMPEFSEIILNSDNRTAEFIVPVKEDYKVTIKSGAGIPLSDLRIEFYSDSALTDLKGFGITDKNGVLTKSLTSGKAYYLSFPEIPAGYIIDGDYSVNAGENVVSLNTAVVTENAPADHNYYIGDVMYDFTVQTVDGETFTLSEILKDRRMVMFNFWYINCKFCIAEFSVFDEVYGEYSDKVGLIALNNYVEETALMVDRFITEKREKKANGENGGIEFTFDVASGGKEFKNSFETALPDGQWDSWPVSVIVDRYGVICLAIDGDIKSSTELKAIFDHFTADDYTQKLYSSYDEFLNEKMN